MKTSPGRAALWTGKSSFSLPLAFSITTSPVAALTTLTLAPAPAAAS